MAQNSEEVRNARLASFEVAVGEAPVLEIRTGGMPANTAAAATGTVLAELTLPTDWMAAPANGVVSKSGTWSDLAANAPGLAGHYRLWNAAKTLCHEQGLCSQNWTQATDVVVGQQMNANGLVYRSTTAGKTAATGTGPTGTGSGISDGTAVWAYVGPADMIIDNTNIAVGQTVQVNGYTRTAGNA